jgi:hypothetical protein
VMDIDPPAQQNAPELSFDATKDTREHQIHPTDPTKAARVSNSLSYIGKRARRVPPWALEDVRLVSSRYARHP